MLKDLVRRNRSYRRFHQNVPVARETLEDLVDLARLSASGMNRQPLKYLLYNDAETNARIFACLGWALRLPEWPGPDEGQRPAAYIIILGDTAIGASAGCDHGIAAQSILLGAVDKGLGGCMLGSIDRKRLRQELAIPEQLNILLVIALGKPNERIILETLLPDGDVAYYRDADGAHHVPKRRLEDIILN